MSELQRFEEVKNKFEKKGISPSRTYMVGIYDPNSENEIRFERVTLPEAVPNTIKSAKQNYLLANIEEAATIRIMICISIEEYLNATDERRKENPSNLFVRDMEDIELTLKMLYDWNAKQKNPSESYSAALTSLLNRVTLMDDFYGRLIKETADMLLQAEKGRK